MGRLQTHAGGCDQKADPVANQPIGQNRDIERSRKHGCNSMESNTEEIHKQPKVWPYLKQQRSKQTSRKLHKTIAMSASVSVSNNRELRRDKRFSLLPNVK
jgi:hypothetical protein